MVVVESKLAVQSLQRACKGKHRNDLLLARGARVFRTLFKALIDLFELEGLITVYSLRRGGASWDFLQHQSMERTLLRGRWQSTSSARIYLQDATAMVTYLKLSGPQQQLATAASKLLLQKLDGKARKETWKAGKSVFSFPSWKQGEGVITSSENEVPLCWQGRDMSHSLSCIFWCKHQNKATWRG